MIVQLTAAGQALLEGNTGPVTVTSFQLGSAYGYIPEATDTAIHGSLIYTGVPSSPLAVSANLVVYSSYLDYDAGPFEFGEIGLFVGTTLFALATGSALISKTVPAPGTSGNSIRIDEYVSVVGTNYAMWLNLAESSNAFQMAVLTSPDLLPQSSQATPNAYVVSGVSNTQSAFIAYTDKLGLWNFDAYQYGTAITVPITASDSQSVTIALADYQSEMNPSYFGEVIVEFTSGQLYSTCRYVQSAITSGNFVTLGFDSRIAMQPAVGDTITFFFRQTVFEVELPIATTSVLGAIIVGDTLTINSLGVLNVAPTDEPVSSVNGLTGAVVLTASDITGFAAVATSGKYSDLSGTPAPYTLPVATTSVLGGVKAPTSGTVTIAADGTLGLGFSPVSSVNGLTGAVVLTALNITGFAEVAYTGNYNNLANLPTIPPAYTLTPATASALGGVIVGSGLAVTGSGVLSNAYTPPIATATQTGVVSIGAGLAVTAAGVLSVLSTYTLPAATASALGGVIVGSGLSISGGVLSVAATGPAVTSFNTRTGAVTLQASDVTGVGGATTAQVAAAKYYDLPGGSAGVVTASQTMLEHVAVRTVTWFAAFAGSCGYASIAATASTTFVIAIGGSQIGTMVFAAGATTATFTLTGSTSIVPGQVLTVTGPVSPDATLANVTFTLLGIAT